MERTSLKELFSLVEMEVDREVAVCGACIDSRKARKGDLYFALPGQRVDGHRFIEDAVAKGAVAAVVLKGHTNSHLSIPFIEVEDVLITLQDLSAAILKKRKTVVVGVTGSHGKTTTKEFLKTLLKVKFQVAATPGNYNSQAGLPLSIFASDGQEDVLVLEMGMSQKGQIQRLVEIAPPVVSIICNVDRAHGEFFSSVQEIALAKGEIFLSPQTKWGVLQREQPFYDLLSSQGVCEKKNFSLLSDKEEFFFKFRDKQVEVFERGKPVLCSEFSVAGSFNHQNFAAAATAAHLLGLSWKEIEQGSQNLQSPSRRFELLKKRGILFIDDAYNASSPLAFCEALKSFPEPEKGGEKVAVIGEMLELGKFSEKAHLEVGQYALDRVDRLLCFGTACEGIVNLWKEKGKNASLFTTRENLTKSLQGSLKAGDVVLVKGSRACCLEKVIEAF